MIKQKQEKCPRCKRFVNVDGDGNLNRHGPDADGHSICAGKYRRVGNGVYVK